jgi:hypothetical protein
MFRFLNLFHVPEQSGRSGEGERTRERSKGDEWMKKATRVPHFELTFDPVIIIKSARLRNLQMNVTASGQSENADVSLADVVSTYVFCNSTLTCTARRQYSSEWSFLEVNIYKQALKCYKVMSWLILRLRLAWYDANNSIGTKREKYKDPIIRVVNHKPPR